jgi:hypothetical protein
MSPKEETAEAAILAPSSAVAVSHVRYEVLGMSFLMAFLMYMERGAIGTAAPVDHARIPPGQDRDGLGHLGV